MDAFISYATCATNGLHMHELQELLGEVFAIHGYTVTPSAALEGRSGTVYTAPLLVEKDGDAIIVDGRLDEYIDRRTMLEFQEVQQDTGASLGILCHLRRADPDAQQSAETVVLWGPDRLARIIGEARLCHIVQAGLPELPLLPMVSMSDDLDDMWSAVATTEAPPTLADAPPTLAEMHARLDQEQPASIPVAEAAPPFEPAMAGEPLLNGDEIDITLEEPPLPDATLDVLAVNETPLAGILDQLLPDDAPNPAQKVIETPMDLSQPLDFPFPLETPEEPPEAPAPEAPAMPTEVTLPDAFNDALDLDKLESLDEVGWQEHGAFPLLPVRLSQDDAHKISEARLFHINNTKLMLQPVYLFDYECDVLAEGSLKYETVRGRLQVHGTDKRVMEVDASLVDPRAASLLQTLDNVEHEERALRLSEEGAHNVARTAVLERHTRVVDVEVGDLESSFSYTEKRKVVPRPDHVRLQPLGVHLRPLWRLTGTNGNLDLDAVDGTLEDQLLRRSDPDVMIIE